MVEQLKRDKEELLKVLRQVEGYLNKHRTWNGMGWTQNHVPNFTAIKIKAIISVALEENSA